jgi:hypothetical protein
MPTKICSKCRVERDISEFGEYASKYKDGHHKVCKNCYPPKIHLCADINMHYCTACKTERPKSMFGLSKTEKSGFRSQCKECDKLYRKKPEVKERQRISQRKGRSTPEGLEKHREENRKYAKIRAERKRLLNPNHKPRNKLEKISPEEKKEKKEKYSRDFLKRKYANETCKIIKEHHEEMKNDPERLPTEFIQKLLGTKCEVTENAKTS